MVVVVVFESVQFGHVIIVAVTVMIVGRGVAVCVVIVVGFRRCHRVTVRMKMVIVGRGVVSVESGRRIVTVIGRRVQAVVIADYASPVGRLPWPLIVVGRTAAIRNGTRFVVTLCPTDYGQRAYRVTTNGLEKGRKKSAF